MAGLIHREGRTLYRLRDRGLERYTRALTQRGRALYRLRGHDLMQKEIQGRALYRNSQPSVNRQTADTWLKTLPSPSCWCLVISCLLFIQVISKYNQQYVSKYIKLNLLLLESQVLMNINEAMSWKSYGLHLGPMCYHIMTQHNIPKQ